MLKHVTQDTFDSVVRENISDFDMTAEEAIADAIKQFEAQGVMTTELVKDASLYMSADGDGDNATVTQPAIAAVNALTELLSASSPPDISAICDGCRKLAVECDVDLAHRCLAGRHGAYAAVMRALNAVNNTDGVATVLSTLCSLCNGQPDLLDAEGADKLTALLITGHTPNVVAMAAKAIRLTCVKHEANRELFMQRDVVSVLSAVLANQRGSAAVVNEACAALRSLTLDDDIRVPFGRAHQNAVDIFTHEGTLNTILELCQEHANDPAVLSSLFATLSAITVRNEFCQQVMDSGGIKLVLSTLGSHLEHVELTRRLLNVLKTVAGNDVVKSDIVRNAGLETILGAVKCHEGRPRIVEAAMASLAAIVLRDSTHAGKLIEVDGAEVILRVMAIHADDAKVQKQACMAVRNAVSRNTDHREAFTSRGAERLIRAALQHHKSAADEAKAALRDLGCAVELKEQWTGSGKSLASV